MDFSFDEVYLITLGGRIDNSVIVWEAATGIALCSSPAGADTGLCLRSLTGRPDRFVSAGSFHFRVWEVSSQGLGLGLGVWSRIVTSQHL